MPDSRTPVADPSPLAPGRLAPPGLAKDLPGRHARLRAAMAEQGTHLAARHARRDGHLPERLREHDLPHA